MEWVSYLALIAIVLFLIGVYGRGRETIGSLKESVKKRKAQNEREAKAKAIESQDPPNNADDVADAFDGLRDNSD